jgi:type IV secretory pathway TraG/TraD family ATPase VirD4
MTPDEVRRLGANEVLIFTRGHPAIRAVRLQYHRQKLFQRRAAIEPPKVSDRIITAPPANAARETTQAGEDPKFLRYGTNREAKVRTTKEELV